MNAAPESLRQTMLLPTIGNTYAMAEDITAEVLQLKFDYRASCYLVFYRYDSSRYLQGETHIMEAQVFADNFSGRFHAPDGEAVENVNLDSEDLKPGGTA